MSTPWYVGSYVLLNQLVAKHRCELHVIATSLPLEVFVTVFTDSINKTKVHIHIIGDAAALTELA